MHYTSRKQVILSKRSL